MLVWSPQCNIWNIWVITWPNVSQSHRSVRSQKSQNPTSSTVRMPTTYWANEKERVSFYRQLTTDKVNPKSSHSQERSWSLQIGIVGNKFAMANALSDCAEIENQDHSAKFSLSSILLVCDSCYNETVGIKPCLQFRTPCIAISSNWITFRLGPDTVLLRNIVWPKENAWREDQ